jgi:hypothetical protein
MMWGYVKENAIAASVACVTFRDQWSKAFRIFTLFHKGSAAIIDFIAASGAYPEMSPCLFFGRAYVLK